MSHLPVRTSGEFAPVCRGGEIGIGGEDAEVVEIVGCTTVVAVRISEVAKVIQRGDLLEGELEEVLRTVGGNDDRVC